MKRYFIALLLVFYLPAAAQSVQYVKGSFRLKEDDQVLIGGIYNDTLQVIKQDVSGGIEIYLYAHDLLRQKKILLEPNGRPAVLQILPFHNYYYLLLRYTETERFRFLKIDASGNYHDETSTVANLFSSGSLLQKMQDQLLWITAYVDSVRSKALFTFMFTDSLLQTKSKHLVEPEFPPGLNGGTQLLFIDTVTAYLVRSFDRRSQRFGDIDLIKFDLAQSTHKTLTLTGNEDSFGEVNLRYNSRDSTILLLAGLNAKTGEGDTTSRFYYATLNRDLEELAPPSLIQVKTSAKERVLFFIQGTALFTEDKGDPHHSIFDDGFSNGYGQREGQPFSELFRHMYLAGVAKKLTASATRSNANIYRSDRALRMIAINPAGSRSSRVIKPREGRVEHKFFNCLLAEHLGKHYLFYSSRYAVNRSGVGYIRVDNDGVPNETFLPVDQQAEYLVSLGEKMGGQLVIPYRQKKQFGLIKIRFPQE